MLKLVVNHEGVNQKDFSKIYMDAFLSLGPGQRSGFARGTISMNVQNNKSVGEFQSVPQVRSILRSWMSRFSAVSTAITLSEHGELVYVFPAIVTAEEAVEEAVFEEIALDVVEDIIEDVVEAVTPEPIDPQIILSMTVKDATAESICCSDEELIILLEAEKEGRNRVTLIRALESQISGDE